MLPHMMPFYIVKASDPDLRSLAAMLALRKCRLTPGKDLGVIDYEDALEGIMTKRGTRDLVGILQDINKDIIQIIRGALCLINTHHHESRIISGLCLGPSRPQKKGF